MRRNYAIIFVLCCSLQWRFAFLAEPFTRPDYGRWVIPTIGEVWPKPQVQASSNEFLVLRPETFKFQIIGQTCDIVDAAMARYIDIIFPSRGPAVTKAMETRLRNLPNFRAFLDVAQIDLKASCEQMPHSKMNESYNIKIDTPDASLKAVITSNSVWGILRGMESFSQLVHFSADAGSEYRVNRTEIVDYPRFSHRGLLVDTARHFVPMNTLKKMVDLLAQNKMNVFHWHMVDDSAFSYESTLFPNMSLYGSYRPNNHVYKPNDVQVLIEYARMRGIRIVPEFDTPGHTQSWGRGVPGLLTQCYDESGIIIPGKYGPIDPTKETTFTFLQKFFGEVFSVFPDEYIHVGGDEVRFRCWANNPDVKAFMEARGWGQDWGRLEQYFMERLLNVTAAASPRPMKYIIWQEIVDDNATLPKDTIIDVWKEQEYKLELEKVTKLGYPVILASPWYLNNISYGLDWDKYYIADPYDFNGTDAQKSQVIGGEASMWAEFVDAVNLIPRTWPRASTVAERLWSDRSVNNASLAVLRLEEHRCRLLRRGYNVDPINGASFCEEEWDP